MKPYSKSPGNIKRVECGLLPPCQKELLQKIRRSQYIARMWCNADQPDPCEGLDSGKFGWRTVGMSLVPKSYEGSPLPSAGDLHVNVDEASPENENDETREEDENFSEAEAEWTDSSDDEES